MILDSTTESITVATSTDAALDVVAFFVDMDATTTEGKNQLTQIAAITTATIVDAPAASTQRQIRAITIRNKGAIPCVVTIGLLAGATTYETHKRTIEAGRTLAYDADTGRWAFGTDDLIVRAGFSSSLFKVGTAPEAVGVYYCFSKDAGFPGAWAVGAPGVNGRDTNNDPGGLYLPAVAGKEIWLRGFNAVSASPCGPELWDFLWVNSGLVVTTTTTQAVAIGYVPPRDANGTSSGEGNVVGLLVTASTTNAAAIVGGTGAGQMFLTYTNSQGVGGQIATPISFPATCNVGSVVWFRLAAGDTGVRSIQQITLGTSLVTGSVSLIIARRLAKMFATAGYSSPANIDQGIRVFPGATLLLLADTVSASLLTVNAEATFEYR